MGEDERVRERARVGETASTVGVFYLTDQVWRSHASNGWFKRDGSLVTSVSET